MGAAQGWGCRKFDLIYMGVLKDLCDEKHACSRSGFFSGICMDKGGFFLSGTDFGRILGGFFCFGGSDFRRQKKLWPRSYGKTAISSIKIRGITSSPP